MMRKKNLQMAVVGAVFLILHTTAVYAAGVLPSSSGSVRELEQNRLAGNEQARLEQQQVQTQAIQGMRRFYLEKFNFTSFDLIDKTALQELLHAYIGREINFNEVREAVNKVTQYYRKQGYTVAMAFLPQQEIHNNEIEIHILLGKMGQLYINNHSRLNMSQAAKFLSFIQSGRMIKNNELETALNNLNDLPGVSAVGLLSAGQEVGSSDFTVTLADEKMVDTIVYTDNYGGKYSGRYRYGLQTTVNNISGSGDKLFAGGMLSNENLHNYNFGYELALGSHGSRLGISYSQMDYTLGDYFAALDAVGQAKTLSIYGSTPLQNTAARHLSIIYGFDNRRLKDEIRAFSTFFDTTTEKDSNSLHLGLVGNIREQGTYTGYSALYYAGNLRYDDKTNPLTEGSFQKFTADINHLRRLGNVTSLQLNFHSQLASRELDSSEQFSLGGANAVRAYPQGEASGDSGYQATAELRYTTPVPNLTFATFIDWGEVTLSKSYGQHRNLVGWGLGVQYAKTNDYLLRLDYARKISGEAFQSEDTDKNGRLWFLAYKLF